jgi:hypothetical protein
MGVAYNIKIPKMAVMNFTASLLDVHSLMTSQAWVVGT